MIMNTAGLKLPASHYLYFEDGNTYLKKGSGNSLMVVTNGGWIQIGPQNSSFCHIMTDRGQFYFNKQVNVAGHVLPYSNNTYSSGLSTNRWTNVYSYAGDFAGSVGIGTNAPSNRLHVEGTTFSNASIRIEKTTTGINEDPGLVLAAANNVNGYRIGSIFFQGGATSYALIRAEMNGTAGAKIYFVAGSQTNTVGNSSTKTLELEDGTITAAAAFRPLTDSSYTLGQASLKWSELYVDKIKDVNNSTGSANERRQCNQ